MKQELHKAATSTAAGTNHLYQQLYTDGPVRSQRAGEPTENQISQQTQKIMEECQTKLSNLLGLPSRYSFALNHKEGSLRLLDLLHRKTDQLTQGARDLGPRVPRAHYS